MPRYTKKDKDEARDLFLKHLAPGDTLYTILRHVSTSGMTRDIGLVILKDGDALHPNYAGAALLGLSPAPGHRDGIRVGGCGMDMGFHLVSNLGRVLFPDGFGCIGKGCPSNDHSNGDRDYTPHREETVCTPACTTVIPRGTIGHLHSGNKHWHRSGDYALKHRWL